MSRPPFPDTARPRVPFVAGRSSQADLRVMPDAARGADRAGSVCPASPTNTIARHARLHILLSGGKQNRHGCRSDGQPADGGPY